MITIRNRYALHCFGWIKTPAAVSASWKLWAFWFVQGVDTDLIYWPRKRA